MKKIVFISDYFINDGIGGAELTTNAIMNYGANRNFEIMAVQIAIPALGPTFGVAPSCT